MGWWEEKFSALAYTQWVFTFASFFVAEDGLAATTHLGLSIP